VPEGDTLHRMAAGLRPLSGRPLSWVSLRERGEVEALSGRVLEGVEARGKHLLFNIEGGQHLRVHLGMKGRMRRLPSAQAARHRFAPLVLCVGAELVVFSHPARAELYRGRPEHSRHIEQLGPDLLGDRLDLDRVIARARGRSELTLGELLLDQRVACGIGNVYKSEVLFACRVNPFARTGQVQDATLRELYTSARVAMRNNLGAGPRVTVDGPPRGLGSGPRHFVYRRAGQACLRCGATLEMRRQGAAARSTYYCPHCQGV